MSTLDLRIFYWMKKLHDAYACHNSFQVASIVCCWTLLSKCTKADLYITKSQKWQTPHINPTQLCHGHSLYLKPTAFTTKCNHPRGHASKLSPQTKCYRKYLRLTSKFKPHQCHNKSNEATGLLNLSRLHTAVPCNEVVRLSDFVDMSISDTGGHIITRNGWPCHSLDHKIEYWHVELPSALVGWAPTTTCGRAPHIQNLVQKYEEETCTATNVYLYYSVGSVLHGTCMLT